MLEKLVKNKGDECVSGFVRFIKVKACKGYKDARDRAAARLSKIHAGRPLEDGTYAAVIRFRFIALLIPLILFLLIIIGLMIKSSNTKALERESETSAEYHHVVPLPDVTEPEPVHTENRYTGLYIDVPGYSDCAINVTSRGIMAYNPENNKCLMKYKLYREGEMIAQSDILSAGMAEYMDIYDAVKEGENKVTIVINSFSEDSRTEFNSVTQTIKIVRM